MQNFVPLTRRPNTNVHTPSVRRTQPDIIAPMSTSTVKKEETQDPGLEVIPLSLVSCDIPIKDIEAWVNRPSEVRQQETTRKDGTIKRPPNSFMLYRSAYLDRAKSVASEENQQHLSNMIAKSWRMEPLEVRQRFSEYAKLESANHRKSHPKYKFSPRSSKPFPRSGTGRTPVEHQGCNSQSSPTSAFCIRHTILQRSTPGTVIDPTSGYGSLDAFSWPIVTYGDWAAVPGECMASTSIHNKLIDRCVPLSHNVLSDDVSAWASVFARANGSRHHPDPNASIDPRLP